MHAKDYIQIKKIHEKLKVKHQEIDRDLRNMGIQVGDITQEVKEELMMKGKN